MSTTRRRLLVMLGAGASVDLRIPSTSELTTAVLQGLQSLTRDQAGRLCPPFLTGEPSEANLLWAVLDQAYRSSANFEHILHATESLASLRRSWDRHIAIPYRVVEAFLCGGPRGGLERCFNPRWLLAARDMVYRSIHASVFPSDQAIRQQAGWACLSGFLQNLHSRFDLNVVTTNYDTIVEQALDWGADEQGFVPVPGEDVSRFCRHAPPLPRLLHLHGSIRFGYRPTGTDPNRFIFEDEFEDLYYHQTPQAALETWFHRSIPSSQAGRDTVIGPLVTGLQKPDKLLAEPYLSYFRHFAELVASTPRILLVGYGFGDAHINAVFSRLTKWHGAERRIVVIDYWPVEEWAPSSIWEEDRIEFFHHVARWAEQSDAMNVHTFPDPWRPTGPGADLTTVYFRGFEATVRQHGDDIIRFLS